MSESSLFWTTGATGDGATAYTQAQCILWLHKTFCGADNEGVLKDVDNELATTGTSSPVATNTGEAYVRGFPYFNSVSVDTAIPTPSANTRIDLIVLRANWAAQTVRITRIAGTEGAGAPSLTQTDGTTWDVPLAQASITTGGVITVTDTREFLHPNIAVDGDMLDDDAVDSQHYTNASIDRVHLAADIVDGTKIEDSAVDTEHIAADSVDDTKAGNRVPQFYRRQGGDTTDWDTAGTTAYTPSAVRMQGGVKAWTGSASEGTLTVTFPVAFSAKPLVFVAPITPATIVTSIQAALTTSVNIYWRDTEGGAATTVNISWLAIGAE